MARFAPRFGATQIVNLATSATAVASTAFSSQAYQVRVATTSASGCFYVVGDGTPTATTSGVFLPANWVDYVTITPGEKISAITATGTGTLNITEVS
jgi:hypothetical protein